MDHIRKIAGAEIDAYDRSMDAHIETHIKYAGYIDRQLDMIKRFNKFETFRVPEDLDYSSVPGLSREVREKLTRIKPRSLGQAYRVSGITPAAISVLSVYLSKKQST